MQLKQNRILNENNSRYKNNILDYIVNYHTQLTFLENRRPLK